ncbi:hypothetical protein QYF61_018165 [Mycteria americana]|uniref:Uncharacterized protein n=1 Tax=Mycteria americana TaxID=33587 RepID=A0AAN7MYM5_MYCAM|nr:hypothetical protein QYF61_018165 [Mycteria americana]
MSLGRAGIFSDYSKAKAWSLVLGEKRNSVERNGHFQLCMQTVAISLEFKRHNVNTWQSAQGTIGLLGCERTLSAHVQLFIHQYPQVLLHRAALNPFTPQPVLIPGVALTQMQDPALGLVEPHEVHMGLLLQLVQIPLDGIPSLRRVNRTTQLGVVCKLAEGVLDPTVYVIDEDVKQYWSRYGPLRDTTCH